MYLLTIKRWNPDAFTDGFYQAVTEEILCCVFLNDKGILPNAFYETSSLE